MIDDEQVCIYIYTILQWDDDDDDDEYHNAGDDIIDAINHQW